MDLVSVWTARGIRSKKIVFRSNDLGYPFEKGCHPFEPQADHPLLVGAVVDWNLNNDLLLFIEEIHMNNTVAIICSKMQNLKQIFQ